MAGQTTQAQLDHQAEQIADCLNMLPWCESTGFLIVEEEEDGEHDDSLNQYLQAFDVLVFDGYVTDFMRLVRALHESLRSRFESRELIAQVTVPYLEAEDPNQVPLSLMLHYDGPDEGYLSARRDALDALDRIVRAAVDEWAQEEDEDERAVEALV
jgi:hypothetical protein